MAGIIVGHDMWKHLMEVMDRLERIEMEAREQHRRDATRIKELYTPAPIYVKKILTALPA